MGPPASSNIDESEAADNTKDTQEDSTGTSTLSTNGTAEVSTDNSPILSSSTAADYIEEPITEELSNGEKKEEEAKEESPKIELFVGDLSFFCQEQNLLELFEPFGHIVEARVRRSDNKGHSLMYGFVKMSNLAEAEKAAQALNDKLFMGRSLR
jgi:RNA recognition motif-containing protein